MQMPVSTRTVRGALVLLVVGIVGATLAPAGSTVTHAQSEADFVPVTDEMLQDPPASEWLMWRRTLDGWGYSPLSLLQNPGRQGFPTRGRGNGRSAGGTQRS